MPIPHDTPENPSSTEPYFAAKTKPFTEMLGTHPVDADAPVTAAEDASEATTPLHDSNENFGN